MCSWSIWQVTIARVLLRWNIENTRSEQFRIYWFTIQRSSTECKSWWLVFSIRSFLIVVCIKPQCSCSAELTIPQTQWLLFTKRLLICRVWKRWMMYIACVFMLTKSQCFVALVAVLSSAFANCDNNFFTFALLFCYKEDKVSFSVNKWSWTVQPFVKLFGSVVQLFVYCVLFFYLFTV